ncbi:MAG: hypothetical protein ACREF3_18620 [Acetobacteraceae bacterium]
MAGKKYFWDPFPETETKSKTLTRQKYQKAEKNCTILDCNVTTSVTFRKPSDRDALRDIEDDSTLLILADGDWKSNVIGNTRNVEVGGSVQLITPAKLAAMLRLDGLPEPHVYLRLLSCYGGGLNTLDSFHDRKLAAGACFAQVLAQELGSTHIFIRVGGYLGSTITAFNKTQVYWNPHEGKVTQADLIESMGVFIDWYNFKGRRLESKREDLSFDLMLIGLLR